MRNGGVGTLFVELHINSKGQENPRGCAAVSFWQADTPKQVPERAPPLLDVSLELLCAGQDQHPSVCNSLPHVLVWHSSGCSPVTTGWSLWAEGWHNTLKVKGGFFAGFYHDQPCLLQLLQEVLLRRLLRVSLWPLESEQGRFTGAQL